MSCANRSAGLPLAGITDGAPPLGDLAGVVGLGMRASVTKIRSGELVVSAGSAVRGSVSGMVDQPTVAVRGEATHEVMPELARISVTVAARDKDRAAVLTRLTERAAVLRGLLDGFGDVVERRETGGVHVRPELKRGGERVSAYCGSFSTTVTVSDFTALGDVILRVADLEQASVSGPWWELRPNSPVVGAARPPAHGDAVSRARE